MAKETNAVIARTVLAELKNGKSLVELTKSLAAYLVEERRLGDVKAILRDVENQLLADEGLLYVHTTSAFPLDQTQIDEISDLFKKQTSAKKVIIEQTINQDVIGGVRCETADLALDLTVRQQLRQLKSAAAA